MRPARAGQSGFTLLEVLIAVALLALLSGLMFSGIRFGARAWSGVNDHVAATADIEALRDVLRRTLGQAYPAFASSDLSDRRIAFEGGPETLALIAPLSDAIEPGVMAWQRFFTVGGDRRTALWLAWRLDLPPADEAVPVPEHQLRLADAITSVRFAYFGAISPGSPPQWVDHWSGQPALPSLIRVSLVMAGPNAEPSPDIFVPLRTTTNTACVYDPVDTVCRRIR